MFSSEDLVEQGNTLPLIPLNIDPPEHVKYRRLLDPLFAPRRIDALEADITDRVNHFVDAFAERGSCDFTAEFAELFPSSVFLGMMGLPWDELDTLIELRDGLLRPGHARHAAGRAVGDPARDRERVYAYFDAILDERAAKPRDDILSLFVTTESDGDRLTRDEVLAICFVLLTAGLDTVTDSLTCFFAFLAQHPEHRRRIVDDPDVIPTRSRSSCGGRRRYRRWCAGHARSRCSAARTVEAGHHVLVNLSAANLDPAEFADPLDVQFDRPVNRHLAFGGGVHRCLGSHLARRELRVALREWHRRIPEYTLSPGYEVGYLPPLRFVPDLQLSWSPRRLT